MNRRADTPLSRADFHAAQGVLLIVRDPPPPPLPAKGQPKLVTGNPAEGVEILIAVWDDGSVTALNGHVDLGTGIRTALAQIVAEELDVDMARINMVLGDTTLTPNQGATIASASLQIHAAPLRLAAAQARHWLVAQAAERLQIGVGVLETHDGRVRLKSDAADLAGPSPSTDPVAGVGYGELIAARHTVLLLDPATPIKAPENYRVVGTPTSRIDIPAKAMGELVFVHDMRVPGMLHGRVVRPPYAGADHGDFIGNTLESVDEASIAHIPGICAVVVIRDFIGIVAEREEHAEQALRELKVTWKSWPGLPDLQDLEGALRRNPSTQRLLVDEGDVDAAMVDAALPMPRTYLWPYQMHASIGPSCALADWQQVDADGSTRLTVWAGTQNPHVLRDDLSRLMNLPDVAIDIVRMEAAGCYGRNGADDVAADAALLARAVGAPVRVQLTREQESAWEPLGAAQLMQVNGGLDAEGGVAAYDFETSYPSNGAPTLALLLTRTIEPVAQAYEMGDRTARPPYAYDNLRVKVNDMAPIVRASWLRGVSALPNSFAHESYIDELATAAGVDPVDFRLRLLPDVRAAELLRATAQKAGWRKRTGPQENADNGLGTGGDILFGQGVAYARYNHSKWPGFGAAWAAWVADVEVNRVTGEVHVRRVVVGHDAGLMVNPAGVAHQVHGNVIQTTSRALKEQVRFAPQQTPGAALAPLVPGVAPSGTVMSREWGSYPIINFREVPVIEVLLMPRPGEPVLGAGESASVPGTAAIANAIFDATGVRFRSPPFTPEMMRAALNPLAAPSSSAVASPLLSMKTALSRDFPNNDQGPARGLWPQRRGLWAGAAALMVGGLGAIAGLMGWRSVIAPVSLSAPVYTQATIERGRVLAAIGDCAVCHTATGGAANAGGRPMETPFGTLYSTNLTPDPETGLGQWSFSAFQRAMREGVSRDGHHLYPAFPYTAFAKTSDDDLTALYAYFMTQPAVRAETPVSEIRFPFSVRPLMGFWNAMFHDASPYKQITTQTAEWNRGAYLVNGLGHCGACHTPRNAMGAEQGSSAWLSGAMVDGWEAPALRGSASAVPWNIDELYRYLRSGHTQHHGIAGGPMADVVRELAAVPDADISAMATYIASFNPVLTPADAAALALQVVATAAEGQGQLLGPAQRMFDSACASCHHDGNGPTLLGVNTPLALNSNLTSARPDNLLRTILDGVREPASRDIGFMPAFREALDDVQIAELASYMRARFAPQERAWADLPGQVARVRAGH
jgi:nicotinate dehydrogenase subunit B